MTFTGIQEPKNSKMNETNQVSEEMSLGDEICLVELLAFHIDWKRQFAKTACRSFLVPNLPTPFPTDDLSE
ncbi:hypothetical protein TNCT_641571 [Trichonephila clavata]|uniref:Uncharacterized protein n=1 Tax=Trichonephila clavata TaxID=2740835 RepID=A0A8X6LH56_TRICU|nr:hypothetical protein TNCT_641571 [Trichonephila clavata]